ncbi:MAG TPA: hypothetical protein VHD62_18840 [Opitutaceae bacterium]|nr:hypothetical protein [Opitutaceae bacterium]
MDSAPSSPLPPARSALARFGIFLLALGALLYAVLLIENVGGYAGGSDSSGYMNDARLLLEGRVHVPPRAIAEMPAARTPSYFYVPLGFKPAPDHDGLVPTYPAGLPLFIAAAAALIGWEHAADVALVLHGLAGVLLTFALARRFGLSLRWAAVAAIALGVSPLYLMMAVQPMSDVPALVWTSAAVLAAWEAGRAPAVRSLRWALAAGAAFAFAVLVRPTDLLALAPVAIALGFGVRRWLAFVAGGLPGGIFFFALNRLAYGKFLTTGYGDTTEMDLHLVPATLVHYAQWLPALFTPVVLGIFALPALRRTPRIAWVLAAWIVAIAGFYAAYYFTHETWWYLRFILPAAPALVIGGLLGLRAVLARFMTPLRSCLCLALALLVCGINGGYWAKKFKPLNSGRGEDVYPLAAAWLREHAPANAVVVAMQTSGSLHFYTNFTLVRWDQIQPADYATLVAALRASGRPLYAALFPFEEEEALKTRLPGRWTQIGSVRQATFWQWSPAPADVAPAAGAAAR